MALLKWLAVKSQSHREASGCTHQKFTAYWDYLVQSWDVSQNGAPYIESLQSMLET